MNKNLNELSKFLSYILRHQPESIGIHLDSDGWVNIEYLVEQANKHNQFLTKEILYQIVETSDKKRFTISENGLEIRAAQGHSTKQVNINHIESTPPEYLYHGTASRFIESIKKEGLISGQRHYVHLSRDQQTAGAVGQRHGKPVVIKIKALLMYQQGYKFYLSDNGVWLVKNVPGEFLIFD
ncbi:RNA 2'-phosphotransferase [Neisseriaceae bacterium ESL0693]|nr:RNA 2'-phosphotransferase [Neisseriaceae bacterium ESL0693]